MAEFSRPWPGVTVGDAGPYSADNWYDVWGNIIQGGNALGALGYRNLGVFLQVGNQLEAAIVGATVTVDTGASLVDGLFHYNNDSVSIPIPAAATAGHSRIDRIVVRKNYQLAVSYTPTGAGPVVLPRTARITVIRGTEAASPGIPGLTQSLTRTDYWDIPIATVLVNAAGVLSVTDLREYLLVWDTDNIADEAITTAKIDDGAVTTIKIADDAVTEIKHNQVDTEYGDYHPLLRQANDAIQADSGGNARGAHAIDLQQVRANANEVATGARSLIIGQNCRITGGDSVAIGNGNVVTDNTAQAFGEGTTASAPRAHAQGLNTTASELASHAEGNGTTASSSNAHAEGADTVASAQNSHAGGTESAASLWSQFARSGNSFAIAGDAQYSDLHLSRSVTHGDASWYALFLNGTTLQLSITPDSMWTFQILISGATQGIVKAFSYRIDGAIENDGGTTALLASTVTTIYEDDADFDARVSADDTNDALLIEVQDSTSGGDIVRWSAVARLSQVQFPA